MGVGLHKVEIHSHSVWQWEIGREEKICKKIQKSTCNLPKPMINYSSLTTLDGISVASW